MNVWLQTKNEHRVEFSGGCTIGRLPENTLVLDDPGVNTAAWKTTESLSETFVPVGHGMILLTPDGKVQSISGHAENWLTTYFEKPARPNGQLPPELESWLRPQLAAATAKTKTPAA